MRRKAPPWWPADETWPPRSGPGAKAWSGFGRRIVRFVVVVTGILIGLPFIASLILAAVFGGWTSVVVAIVFWFGLALLLGLIFRSGLRTWRPAKALIDTAGRLADGDYSARVELPETASFSVVVNSFNQMAERLERAENDRRQLLADVGHEMRTPLTIVRGELEAIADGVRQPSEEEIRRLLDDIAVMERLLDDLQTLSTAEAGMLRIHPEPTDMVHLVHDAVERHQPLADRSNVLLSVEPETVNQAIEANVDPVRIREVVDNLLANALRATPAGGRIDVKVCRRSLPTGEAAVVEVIDTGQGLAPDDVERVFERFHKGPESDGSGLGLTITRNLVQAHGGEITLQSDVGAGTTVSVELPL